MVIRVAWLAIARQCAIGECGVLRAIQHQFEFAPGGQRGEHREA